MQELDDNECQDGGWTLVMKTNGNQVSWMCFLKPWLIHIFTARQFIKGYQ